MSIDIDIIPRTSRLPTAGELMGALALTGGAGRSLVRVDPQARTRVAAGERLEIGGLYDLLGDTDRPMGVSLLVMAMAYDIDVYLDDFGRRLPPEELAAVAADWAAAGFSAEVSSASESDLDEARRLAATFAKLVNGLVVLWDGRPFGLPSGTHAPEDLVTARAT